MGTKWAHADVLDNGPEYIRTQASSSPSAVVQHVVQHYSAGDSYATVVANSIGSVTMDLADLVMSSTGSPALDRTFTVAAKAGVTADASTDASPVPDLHFVLVDSTNSKVLLVTNESTDQAVVAGNTMNIPSWTYTVPQPV